MENYVVKEVKDYNQLLLDTLSAIAQEYTNTVGQKAYSCTYYIDSDIAGITFYEVHVIVKKILCFKKWKSALSIIYGVIDGRVRGDIYNPKIKEIADKHLGTFAKAHSIDIQMTTNY